MQYYRCDFCKAECERKINREYMFHFKEKDVRVVLVVTTSSPAPTTYQDICTKCIRELATKATSPRKEG